MRHPLIGVTTSELRRPESVALRPEGDGTEVRLSSEQTLRGMSRFGSPLMRRGQGAILDEALDGIERALSGKSP